MLDELMVGGAIESVHISRLRRIPLECVADFVDHRRDQQAEAR